MGSSSRYIWTLFLLMYCGLIYFLSDQSRLPLPDLLDFRMSDKLIHASAYALMAFLFWQAGKAWMLHHASIIGSTNHAKKWLLLALINVIVCSSFGLSDEWHQSFVAGRDASVWDWMADTLGASLLTIVVLKRELMSLK